MRRHNRVVTGQQVASNNRERRALIAVAEVIAPCDQIVSSPVVIEFENRAIEPISGDGCCLHCFRRVRSWAPVSEGRERLPVGPRIQVQDIPDNRINPAHRRMQRDLLLCRQCRRSRYAHLFSLSFIREKPECLIAEYRASCRAAELIVLKNILRLRQAGDGIVPAIEIVPCVQMIVAEVLENAAMNIVGA